MHGTADWHGGSTVDELINRHRPKPFGGWGNPVCAPVYVEGAEPGDTLQVEILELTSGDWGWTGITDGFGLLAGNDDGSESAELAATYCPSIRSSVQIDPTQG